MQQGFHGIQRHESKFSSKYIIFLKNQSGGKLYSSVFLSHFGIILKGSTHAQVMVNQNTRTHPYAGDNMQEA